MKMAIIGIVAEYNPFHTGHARHIALSKAPGDTVICCMSGHFVQRGDCAITDKWRRAGWALRSGADLVLELPTRFALSSAESFARAAVELLCQAGITHLSFGCETPELSALLPVAEALNSPDYRTGLAPFLKGGVSFPVARQRWLAETLGPEKAAAVSMPNNTLAVEYLRFLPSGVTPMPILRTGTHDGAWSPELGQPPSASALRQRLCRGESVSAFLPSGESFPLFRLENAQTAILSQLRRSSLAQLEELGDGGEGLSQRLFHAARTATSLEELFFAVKSRHITLSRVRRVVLRAWLDLKGDHWAQPLEYVRILGLNRRGAEHLRSLRSMSLPLITKPAAYRSLLAEEARLTDQFALCGDKILPAGEEFRHSPVFF